MRLNEFAPNKQDMAEGVNDYLWHGSKSEHEILYPQQANDTGGKEESNKNAVYATPSAKTAIAMGLTTPESDTGMFPNDPQMVLFSGNIRKGQMVYLHKVPKDLFIKHNSREWYSKPGVEAVKPIEVVKVPVDQWLHLIRQATPRDLELRKKYMKQGVAEGTGSYPEVLYHGSTQEINGPLTPRQAHDIGGKKGSNKNAIYATDDPNFAIAYSLAERGSDTGTFGWKKEPRLIFFGGKIRHGKDVYIHVLPTRDEQGRPLFTRGAADAEWYSVPGVEEITPIKVITKPVDQYLHLLRKPTPEELKIFLAKKAKDKARKQGVSEGLINESALFLNPNTVIVGQVHGQPLDLSPETLKRVKAIAAKHGAWYEGNGADRAFTKGVIDNYVGSFDDDVATTMANPNDPKWIYVLFANVDANNRVQRVGVDPKDTIFNRLLDTAKDNSFQGIGFTAQALKKFLAMSSEGKYDFVKMSQQPATQENLTRFLKAGEALMWPANWEQYPNKAGKIAKAATVDVRDQYLASRKSGVYVVGSGHLKAIQQISGKQAVAEGQFDSMVKADQAERNAYKKFVADQAGGDWSRGARLYAKLKNRPADDIFGDDARLQQFMQIKFDFGNFTKQDWRDFWLLSQHADKYPGFQKKALDAIEKHLGQDNDYYRYLSDRISCARTGQQKYGTQDGCEKQGVAEEYTFDQPRRLLNLPELIRRGAIFLTHPHGPKGWETDRPGWDFSLITLQNVLEKSPPWVADYKKYLSKDKKITQDFINRISDEKYNQILWSIKKLGIPDQVAFLDKQGVAEGKFRSKDIEEFIPPNDKLDDFKSKYLPDWEMLDHRTLQAKYVAQDHRHAQEFTEWINNLCEKMDHFAEVTQDVAEVTVKTTTFDVKGLTILDFKLAMAVDKYAERNDIEQVRMSGNFGMHE